MLGQLRERGAARLIGYLLEQFAVLVGITALHAPAIGDLPANSELDALRALSVYENRFARQFGVGDHDVSAIEVEDRGGQRQARIEFPLRTDLDVLEFLGVEGS